ncbi:MAG: hypothetical protein FWE17_01320 [Alphaproteobacteria bacterium]|nr:hypothetical protein [Alphaproteobacteria bacterium]MCL2758092.1 hypothetical protein [Alphaproteobacteria bacterium]
MPERERRSLTKEEFDDAILDLKENSFFEGAKIVDEHPRAAAAIDWTLKIPFRLFFEIGRKFAR